MLAGIEKRGERCNVVGFQNQYPMVWDHRVLFVLRLGYEDAVT